jgi:hypothetical protein
MSHDPLDLTSIDPTGDRLGWERLVRSIVARAEPELARRAARAGVLTLLGRWMRPALAAAAVLAVASAAALTSANSEASAMPTPGGLVQALDVPEPVSRWLDEDRSPDTYDVILALEVDLR